VLGEVRSSTEPISEMVHKDFKEPTWHVPSPSICQHTGPFELPGVALTVPWRTRGQCICIWSKHDTELLKSNSKIILMLYPQPSVKAL